MVLFLFGVYMSSSVFFFFKQKTAYEMRISDWSSDVCSSDLRWRDQTKAGQKVDGRIINTTSGAGLQGSIGQSNYVAAKGGIASLTLVQAAELGRYGITVNALAPAERTGMTEGPFAEMMKKTEDGRFDSYGPAHVQQMGGLDEQRVGAKGGGSNWLRRL